MAKGGDSNGSSSGGQSVGGGSFGGGSGVTSGHGLGQDGGHGGFGDGFSSAVGGNYAGGGGGQSSNNNSFGSSFGNQGNQSSSNQSSDSGSISRARDSFSRREGEIDSGVNSEGLASSLATTPSFGFDSQATKDAANLAMGGWGSEGTQEQKSSFDSGYTNQANSLMAQSMASSVLSPALGGLISKGITEGAGLVNSALQGGDAFAKAGRDKAGSMGPVSGFGLGETATRVGNVASSVIGSALGPIGGIINAGLTANALTSNPSYQGGPSVSRAQNAFSGGGRGGTTTAPATTPSMANSFLQPPSISGDPALQLSTVGNTGYDLSNKFTPGN